MEEGDPGGLPEVVGGRACAFADNHQQGWQQTPGEEDQRGLRRLLAFALLVGHGSGLNRQAGSHVLDLGSARALRFLNEFALTSFSTE